MARIAALAVVLALAALPATAGAVTNPFVPAPAQQAPAQQAPAQQAPTPTPVAPTTTGNGGGISNGQVALLSLAAVALIAGIWMVIVRDARRATAGRVRTGRSRRDDDGAVRTGGSATKASHRSRKLSAAEKQRRKRGKAR